MVSSFILIFLVMILFNFHIILLAIEVVIALLLPLLMYFSKHPYKYFSSKIARRYMRYIAITYAAQQVFMTMATLLLILFFPDTLNFLDKGLYYTWIIFILLYAFRLFLISTYWFGWDYLPEHIHHFDGTLFAVSGVGLIYIDSVILSFLSYPAGITSINPLNFNFIMNMVNPLATPLFLALLLFAFTLTFTILGFIHAKRVTMIDSHKMGKEDLLGRIYMKIASITGLLLIFPVSWYILSLQQFSPYKFSNMFGGLGIEAEGPNLSWLFILLLLFYVVYLVSANMWNGAMEQLHSLEHVRDKYPRLIYVKLISIALSFLTFLIINLISQTPYVVSDPRTAEIFPFLDMSSGVEQKAAIPDVISIAIFVMIPLFGALVVLLFSIFSEAIGTEEEMKLDKPSEKIHSLE